MPITDLTDRVPDTPTLVRFGKIRKGGPKPESGKRPGPDLKHFRITLEPDYEHLAPMISAELGDEPREIPIVFVGETVDEVFPTWFEAWLASGLQHRCDGATQKHGVIDSGQYKDDLPCQRGDGDLQDQSTFACGCTRVGKLHVAIPFLWGIQGEYGMFVLDTHSIHDILEFHGRLSTMHDLFGTLRMIPAILGRAERQISYASAKAKSGRQNRTASLLTIRENMRAMTRTHPQIAANLQNVIAASAGVETLELPIGEQPALPAPESIHDKEDAVTEWFRVSWSALRRHDQSGSRRFLLRGCYTPAGDRCGIGSLV